MRGICEGLFLLDGDLMSWFLWWGVWKFWFDLEEEEEVQVQTQKITEVDPSIQETPELLHALSLSESIWNKAAIITQKHYYGIICLTKTSLRPMKNTVFKPKSFPPDSL